MQSRLQDTADGCALLEYLLSNLGSKLTDFTPVFCDVHVTEYRRRWLAAGKDEAVGKATYPSLVGLEESKKIADNLIAEAKELLSPYAPKLAAPLLGLADYIKNRQN